MGMPESNNKNGKVLEIDGDSASLQTVPPVIVLVDGWSRRRRQISSREPPSSVQDGSYRETLDTI